MQVLSANCRHQFSRVCPHRHLVYMEQKLRGKLGGVPTTGVIWGPGWLLQKLLEIFLCRELLTSAVGGHPTHRRLSLG